MSESEQNAASAASQSLPGESFTLTFPDESPDLRDLGLWAAVLVLLTLVAYWPVTEGQFIWQDSRTVADNVLLAQPGGMGIAWLGRWQDPGQYPLPQYHPVAFTSNRLVYGLFGRDQNNLPIPFPYHLVNLLLHAGAAVLVWLVLRQLKLPGAWLAAAVFALHPINTEAVAWISQRDTVLCGVLFFASIYTYLHFADEDARALAGPISGETPVDPARRWGMYAGSFLLFILAMLSKSTAFALPFVLLLVLWWQRRLTWRHLGWLVPFIIVAVGLGLAAADFEHDFAGAVTPTLTFAQRLIVASSALWFYVGKLLWPVGLTFIYPSWAVDAHHLWQFVPLAVAVIVVVGLWLARHRIGRGPLVAVLAFALCVFPLLGFFNIIPMQVTSVADHYAYLATVPFIAWVIAGATRAVRQVRLPRSRAATAVGLSVILLIALGATTWTRTHVFKDNLAVWQDTVVKNPNSWFVQSSLAVALRTQANVDLAAADQASVTLGQQELNEALDHAQKAAALNPDDAQAQLTWGRILIQRHDLQGAVEHLSAAVKRQPSWSDASQDLAETLIRLKQPERAIAVLDEALANQPSASKTHHLLAVAYADLKNNPRAIAEEMEAIRLQPDSVAAHEGLANLLAAMGKNKEAIQQLTIVAQLQQDRPEVWNLLGKLYMKEGKWTGAVQFFKAALDLDPTSTEIKKNMQEAMEKQRQQAATQPATTRGVKPEKGAP